tara:strand:- start:10994 stop:11269 length:276 start_codon:yes stop_codon:yes gene_type:complete
MRFRIATTADKDVELFVQADVGAGQSTLAGENVESVRLLRYTYFSGLGVNMWLHPQFAIGGRLGIRGEAIRGDAPVHTLRSDAGIHVLAVF